MRLITYLRDGKELIGGWINDDRQFVDLALASELTSGKTLPAFSSMQFLIEAGSECWERAQSIIKNPPAESVFESKDCTVLAPLPRPVQIRDFLCFPDHIWNQRRIIAEKLIREADNPDRKRTELEAAGFFEVPRDFYESPVFYTPNRLAFFGPDVDIIWPAYSKVIDYEMEWAAVIGKERSLNSKENAKDCIFGYTIFNDWSARDEQAKVMRRSISIGPAGSKDFANGLGPCIVTADEIANPYGLSMKVRVNGVEVSHGNTSGMHYKFEDVIEHLTRVHSLFPGEVLASGTVGGGCSAEAGIVLKHGDVIELEVQDIGILRNRVLAMHMNPESSS